MTKELRTAAQLSDMIVSALGVRELGIEIRKDHAYGWQPTVVSSPGDLIGDLLHATSATFRNAFTSDRSSFPSMPHRIL
jgi:hypothetical protein